MNNNSTFDIKNSTLHKSSKIVVFGATGLVGSAIVGKLLEKGYTNIIASYHNRIPNSTFNIQHSTLKINSVRYEKLDLLDSVAVEKFFKSESPEFIFLAAAKVGGIAANNTYRADFIYQNLQIQNNIIHQSHLNGVEKLMFLGSTCIYPKNCPQPMKEEYLLTGELEYTNEPYAIAKIAGIKMCESYNLQYGTNFISVMPTNLYGPNDNFDLEKSHVLPALIRKIHLGKCLENNDWRAIRKDLMGTSIVIRDSKLAISRDSTKKDLLQILDYYGITYSNNDSRPAVQVEIWGSGKPMREFLWSEDMADACIFLMEKIDFSDIVGIRDNPLPLIPYLFSHNTSNATISPQLNTQVRNTHLNIGTGEDIAIKDLAYLIKNIIGFKGGFYFNSSKSDGTMRKLTDPSKLQSLGWKHEVDLKEGIKKMYEWYTKNEFTNI